ncbi:MAG: ECF transporter S component [Longicatena sp.]
MNKISVNELVLGALGMALVFLATFLIKIPNGIQGYFNLGDGFIMLFACFVNPFLAFLIGGVGSGLADVVGGYGIYFIPTLIIKGVEGCMVAYVAHKYMNKANWIIYIIAGCWMVLGYLVCDSFINQSFALGLSGVLANLLQGGIGVVIAYISFPLISKIVNKG